MTINSALLEVLQIMGRRWKHKFAPSEVPNLLPMWRERCANIPVAALLETAQNVVNNWPDGPPPSHIAFAAEAMKLARANDPTFSESSTYEGPLPVVPDADRNRAGALILRIKSRIEEKEPTWSPTRAWQTAMQIWDRLLDAAKHPDIRSAWEKGHVPEYFVDEMVAKWEVARHQQVEIPREPASTFRDWRSSSRVPQVAE